MASHPGRNDACPCGSGKKYKKCCELKQHNKRGNTLLLVIVGSMMAAGVVAGITAFTERGHVGATQGVWSRSTGTTTDTSRGLRVEWLQSRQVKSLSRHSVTV